MGLDEKAVEAVKQFRFKPAMENGKPVSGGDEHRRQLPDLLKPAGRWSRLAFGRSTLSRKIERPCRRTSVPTRRSIWGLPSGQPRTDGFHGLATMYQTLALHDVVTVSAARSAETSL